MGNRGFRRRVSAARIGDAVSPVLRESFLPISAYPVLTVAAAGPYDNGVDGEKHPRPVFVDEILD